MAGTFGSSSQGNIRRRKEKEASAKIRGRQEFIDQSNVDKIYQWVNTIKENWNIPITDATYDKYPKGSLVKKPKKAFPNR